MSIVANSWKKSPQYKSDLFFGYADFDSRGSEVFKLVLHHFINRLLMTYNDISTLKLTALIN